MIKNKKGGVPLSIVLIVILSILLLATSLVSFVLRDKNFESTIYSTSVLDDIYSREAILNSQIQNMVDNSFQGITSEEDFISNFRTQLNSYKDPEGVFLNPDLKQVEEQLLVEKVKIEKVDNVIKIFSITLNIDLKKDLVIKDNKKVFEADYKYIKTFESKS